MDNYNKTTSTPGTFTELPVFKRQHLVYITSEYARLDAAFFMKWQQLLNDFEHLRCKTGIVIDNKELFPAIGISHTVRHCPNDNDQPPGSL